MSYRDTVAAVNGFQLRKHGHNVPSRIGTSFEDTSPVPSREPLVAKQLLSKAKFDLMLERNRYLLELNGTLPGAARLDAGLEDKVKSFMQQLSDLGSIDPNDPVDQARFNDLNNSISKTSNRIIVLKKLISNLDVKIKDVSDRIQKIDDNELQEKQNVLARDRRGQEEAKNKKELLAKQQRDLEEAKKKKASTKVAKGRPSVPSTPSISTPSTSAPSISQSSSQTTSEVVETSGSGLGLAIGLVVVGTAVAVATHK